MGCPSQVELGDSFIFSITTHDPDSGVLTDADSAPTYRIYELETATAILTGTMATLDTSNTTGFYTETINCTAANGFEVGNSYTIYIEATVDSDTGGISYGFTVTDILATVDSIIATGVVSTAVTSGSYDYALTAGNIILEALELLAVPEIGQSVNAHDLASCLRSLNLMIKAWQAEGIGLWRNVEGTLFLGYGEYSYDIGPTGDHCSTTAYKTEIATAASSGASTITVDDDDNITDGDYIGIELDDGTLQWTTVDGTPSANVVTLDDVLTDDVAVDNHVYNYTSKIMRPVELIEARLVNSDANERPLKIKSRDEYMRISDKDSTGSANLIYFEPLTGNVKVHVWPACGDVKEYIKFTGKTLVQDLELHTEYPDFPQEWMLALAWNLAILVAPKFGKALDPNFEAKALTFKQSVQDFDHENVSVTFIRGR